MVKKFTFSVVANYEKNHFFRGKQRYKCYVFRRTSVLSLTNCSPAEPASVYTDNAMVNFFVDFKKSFTFAKNTKKL